MLLCIWLNFILVSSDGLGTSIYFVFWNSFSFNQHQVELTSFCRKLTFCISAFYVHGIDLLNIHNLFIVVVAAAAVSADAFS